MPISASDKHEQEAFGTDAIAVLAVALEDALRQLRFRLREQAVQSFR
jgi:hypothetical protein